MQSNNKFLSHILVQTIVLVALAATTSAQEVRLEFRMVNEGTHFIKSFSGFELAPGDPLRVVLLADAISHSVSELTLEMPEAGVIWTPSSSISFLAGNNIGPNSSGIELITNFTAPGQPFGLFLELRVLCQPGAWSDNLVDELGTSVQNDWFFGGGGQIVVNGAPGSFLIEQLTISTPPSSYCSALANSTGSPAAISVAGSQSVAANDLQVSAQGLPPNVVGLFLYGENQISPPFPALGDGFRCVGGQVCRLAFVTADAMGGMQTTVPLGAGGSPGFPICDILPGSSWDFQLWYRDPGSMNAGFNTTNAVAVDFYD